MLTLPLIPQTYDARAISEAFTRIENQANSILTLEVFRAEPAKPRTGMVVIADGTNWNPGSGTGAYVYISSWRRID